MLEVVEGMNTIIQYYVEKRMIHSQLLRYTEVIKQEIFTQVFFSAYKYGIEKNVNLCIHFHEIFA